MREDLMSLRRRKKCEKALCYKKDSKIAGREKRLTHPSAQKSTKILPSTNLLTTHIENESGGDNHG
jgi:hypothetical protein